MGPLTEMLEMGGESIQHVNILHWSMHVHVYPESQSLLLTKIFNPRSGLMLADGKLTYSELD